MGLPQLCIVLKLLLTLVAGALCCSKTVSNNGLVATALWCSKTVSNTRLCSGFMMSCVSDPKWDNQDGGVGFVWCLGTRIWPRPWTLDPTWRRRRPWSRRRWSLPNSERRCGRWEVARQPRGGQRPVQGVCDARWRGGGGGRRLAWVALTTWGCCTAWRACLA